jgi:hypothetical protein
MKYTIEYFHARVKNDIESWPDGILADYARLAELLMEFGPICGCRIRAPWATVSLSCGHAAVKASVVHCIALLLVNAS